MYAVRNRVDPRRVVVVTRGTNPKAILDWLREDFDVGNTVAWPYGKVPDDLKPRVSRATFTGLQILQKRFGAVRRVATLFYVALALGIVQIKHSRRRRINLSPGLRD